MDIRPQDYGKIIAPPPVVLVSTLYGNVKSIAPFGMNMPVSHDPPMIALGIARRTDTLENIKDTGEFVVAVPGPDLLKEIEMTARAFPRDVSEFEKAGLTPLQSKLVKPFRVKECQSNIECNLEWFKVAGDHCVVVGRVVAADIVDHLFQEDLSRDLLNPVYYVKAKKARYATKGPLILGSAAKVSLSF